jgi:hypothetical protein
LVREIDVLGPIRMVMEDSMVEVYLESVSLTSNPKFMALVKFLNDVKIMPGGSYLRVHYLNLPGYVRRTPELESELTKFEIKIST